MYLFGIAVTYNNASKNEKILDWRPKNGGWHNAPPNYAPDRIEQETKSAMVALVTNV